ncbi:Zinc finger and BTB domain-containing protein 49 [Eumeta japonica]|uniref:Zinc finger and BTB domain-containing protein 49 n=1 Tax=Eumeta variegata TaxID=151549 RepID=A0A4C1THD5_EUMVA|nr:Zinc finger and BTB domain-containing protein 49 [Eumeta japonica]
MLVEIDNDKADMELCTNNQNVDVSSVLLVGQNDAPSAQEHLEIIGIQYLQTYIPVEPNLEPVAEQQIVAQTGAEETALPYMVNNDGVYLKIEASNEPENNTEQANGGLDCGYVELLPFSLPVSYDSQKEKGEDEVINAEENKVADCKSSTASDSTKEQNICTICDKQFSCKGNVTRHIRIHTGKKLFTCKLCNAKFAAVGNLKKHTLKHLGADIHVCELCGTKFTRANSKKLHMRKHFMCKVCKAAFVTAFDLKRHKCTHNNERSYRCHVCGMKLKTPYTLKAHVEKHFIERPHKCEVCGISYWHAEGLRRHEISYSIVEVQTRRRASRVDGYRCPWTLATPEESPVLCRPLGME